MSNPSNPSSPEATNPPASPAAQLTEARLKQWHQQGEALLTIENLRSWINSAGLVLFAPRPQIVSPAPTLVEAVLGAPNPNPTIEQTAEARDLLARLVAEGLAVPLNLLGVGIGTVHAGAPGDTPDFVASAAVFSYIFTLRGDKAWKQPPATAGAFKVSPLALATHEALARRGPSSAYDLANDVGKEVTEAAVLRSLAELWTHLRVLPMAQPNRAPTLWELASARLTKQIKAGANAGQPSALSALISLYLGQAVVASEDEIESFLSPLAARSRIRDVIHALLSARQLDTSAVQGRTMLYVASEMPAFLAPQIATAASESHGVDKQQNSASNGETALAGSLSAAEAAETDEADGEQKLAPTAETRPGEAAPRIVKFVPKPRKIGTGYLAKAKPSRPVAKPFAASESGTQLGFNSRPSGDFKSRSSDGRFKPGFNSRTGSGPASNRERRPFSKPAARGFDKKGGFDKPWDEEKARRRGAAAKPSELPPDLPQAPTDLAALAASQDAPRSTRPRAPSAYNSRTKEPANRRAVGGKPTFGRKPAFGGKPAFGRKPAFDTEGRPPRRDFAPRRDGHASDSRPPRKTFSKPGTFGRKREGSAARPAFGGDSRPPHGDFAPRKPVDSSPAGASNLTGKRVYRKFDAPRNRPPQPGSSPRPRTAQGPGKAFGKPSEERAPRNFAGKPGGFSAKKPYVKSSGKPGRFAGKKPFAKSSGKPGAASTGKPASTFAKFAGNRKPFGKRPPARKFKPGKDGAA